MKSKEEKLSMIIEELRMNLESDKQELAREQVEKLVRSSSFSLILMSISYFIQYALL